MLPHNHFFEIYPKVLPVGRRTEITIRALFDHVQLREGRHYELLLLGREFQTADPIPLVADQGVLTFSFTPAAEQEYELVLFERDGESRVKKEGFNFYAVHDDLFNTRPWKGDFHVHSCRSDGRETPAYVAARYRQAGFDFFALTDHHHYEPSLEAIAALEELATDFRVYPGEEVHPPSNPIHHINFGGAFSVNDLHREKESYEAEVDLVEASLERPELTPAERRILASSIWVFNKIREAGGLSLFCHPYWVNGNRYNVSEPLIQALFAEMPFDAFELLGGFSRSNHEGNALQVARWGDERAKGRKIPIVGVSDSHGTENADLFNWYFTLAFAPTPDFQDLKYAITSDGAVAVQAIPGECPQIYGPFRLVKFAYFLLREVLPLHDAECAEEGRLMLKVLAGDEEAATLLNLTRHRVEKLFEHLWA
jgi:hypothetical protein